MFTIPASQVQVSGWLTLIMIAGGCVVSISSALLGFTSFAHPNISVLMELRVETTELPEEWEGISRALGRQSLKLGHLSVRQREI